MDEWTTWEDLQSLQGSDEQLDDARRKRIWVELKGGRDDRWSQRQVRVTENPTRAKPFLYPPNSVRRYRLAVANRSAVVTRPNDVPMYVVQNKQTAVQHSAAVAYESYSLFWTRTNEIGFNLQVKQWRNEHSQVAASRKVRACPITWWRQHGQPPDRRRRCGYFISYL